MREGKKPLVSFNKIEKEEEIDEYYYYDNSIVQAEIYDEEISQEEDHIEFKHLHQNYIFDNFNFKYIKKENIFQNYDRQKKDYKFQPLTLKDSEFYILLTLVVQNKEVLLNLYFGDAFELILGDLENPFKNIPQEKDCFNGFITDVNVRVFFEHGALFIEFIPLNKRKGKQLLLNSIEVEILKRQIQEFKYFLELVENALEF